MEEADMRWHRPVSLALLMLMTALALTAGAQSRTETKPQLDVPYVPTHEKVVAEMLRVANVRKDDVLYDLGSGDGRIVITAAREHGTRGTGIDIDPERVRDANENARR